MANEAPGFEDVAPDHPARRHIAAVVRAGIVSPLSLNPPRFGPDYAVTRAQLAVYLCRAMGLEPQETPSATFADVSKSHWAYGFVEAIYARGVMLRTGGPPPRFAPDEALTRGTIAVILCRAKGFEPLPRDTPTFADVPPDHWGYGWIERLVDRDSWCGVLMSGGCDPGPPPKFCPDDIVTRASLAVFLGRAFGIVRE